MLYQCRSQTEDQGNKESYEASEVKPREKRSESKQERRKGLIFIKE